MRCTKRYRDGNTTGTYRSWSALNSRCRNPNHHAYPNYGGRGIKVCDRWRDFENFLEDMGERPENTTIDRIDNDGDYRPGNCRWATRAKQASNMSINIKVEVDGKTLHLSEAARTKGIKPDTAFKRYQSGVRGEALFSTEDRPTGRKGEKAAPAVLTDEKVKAIKSRLPKETSAKLAREFKVSHGAIQDIKHGRTWKHITATTEGN